MQLIDATTTTTTRYFINRGQVATWVLAHLSAYWSMEELKDQDIVISSAGKTHVPSFQILPLMQDSPGLYVSLERTRTHTKSEPRGDDNDVE